MARSVQITCQDASASEYTPVLVSRNVSECPTAPAAAIVCSRSSALPNTQSTGGAGARHLQYRRAAATRSN
jgi:hypothetical protein